MPFSPSDISGLGLWLKADDYSQADNSAAPSTWADDSGHTSTANHSKSGTVTYRTARTPAGGPALVFTSAGSYASAGNPFPSWTAATVFIVLKDTGSGGSENRGPWYLAGGDISFYRYSDGKIYDGAFTTGRAGGVTPGVDVTQWRVFCITSGSGSYNSYLDNTSLATASLTFSAPTSSQLGLGMGGVGWYGEVAEVIAYDTVLSSTDRGSVYTYLQRHFTVAGITVTVPSPMAFTVEMVATPTVSLTAGHTITVPAPMAFTLALHAPAVKLTPTFTAYDLDSNSSQALNIPIQFSGVLLTRVKPTAPPAMTAAQVSIWKVTAVMPDPTLDGYGRPT